MALTLPEAAKLSNDVLLVGVIEEIIKDSPIVANLPFINIVGNGLTYNRELELPKMVWVTVGDTLEESTPTYTQETAVLRELIGNAEVDNFLKATRSDLQDLETAVIEAKAKAARHEVERTVLYGDNVANLKQPDGIRKMIDLTTAPRGTRQIVASGTAGGAALSFDKLDELIDKVQGGKPDALIMSKRTRRLIQSKARAAHTHLEISKDAFGNFLTVYNGVPFWLTDWQLDTHRTTGDGINQVEDSITAGDESVIYAVRLGEGALAGLQTPEGLAVTPIGQMETKNATLTRISWYVSFALFCTVTVAAYIGFNAS